VTVAPVKVMAAKQKGVGLTLGGGGRKVEKSPNPMFFPPKNSFFGLLS